MNWKSKKVFWTGLAGLVVISLLAWFLLRQEMASDRPIQQVKLTSELKQLSQEEIDQVLSAYVGVSFWEVELNQIQSDLTRLDWVSQAVVKRSWPDQLIISIEEQNPVARWSDNGLINHKGEVFFPSSVAEFENFVRLDGELLDSSKILAKLAEFQAILNQLEWPVSQLVESPEGGWQVQIMDGPVLLIAKEQDLSQLTRFVRAYEHLKDGLRKSAQVYDLRYSNGFSIKRVID
ncbi:MAG: FtsQ-type POTRA domain-containing protein [Pseudomonadota bacterium]|nr:FtsQ-type POTRA domain-containing protein [Pseudomonadota bacterium]